MDLLTEFKRRYAGDASQFIEICDGISKEYHLNLEDVANFVYANLYIEDPDEFELEEVTIDDK